VDDVADIVDWEDAGFETDWSEYSIEIMELVVYWRDAEKNIRELRARRFDALVQGFLK
jgi:hypothetical protein